MHQKNAWAAARIGLPAITDLNGEELCAEVGPVEATDRAAPIRQEGVIGSGLGCAHGRHIPNGAVRPFFVVLSSPGLNHALCFRQCQKPVFVEALIPKLAVTVFGKHALK